MAKAKIKKSVKKKPVKEIDIPGRVIMIRMFHFDMGMMSPEMTIMDFICQNLQKAKELPEMIDGVCKKLQLENCRYMEWTGKVDKNGRKIFEDDIIAVDIKNQFGSLTKEKAIVFFCDDCNSYKGMNPKNRVQHCTLSNKVEVIGNVWQNGDLIE